MKARTLNQFHHIGNHQKDLRKIIFKHDGCTMVLFKDLPYWKACVRVTALNRMYPDWCGKLLIIR